MKKQFPSTQYVSGTTDADAAPDENPDSIKTGMIVEHARFGKGKVLNIEGSGNDRKASVSFVSGGEKKLLLKFAKLRIMND